MSCCDFQERFQTDPGLSYDMFLFLAEDSVKGMEGGLMHHHYSSRIAGCTCQDSYIALHILLLMMFLSLGPLYRVPSFKLMKETTCLWNVVVLYDWSVLNIRCSDFYALSSMICTLYL